jgi:hypothetical protein
MDEHMGLSLLVKQISINEEHYEGLSCLLTVLQSVRKIMQT